MDNILMSRVSIFLFLVVTASESLEYSGSNLSYNRCSNERELISAKNKEH